MDAKSPKPDLSTICLTVFLIGSKILKITIFFFFLPKSFNHTYSPGSAQRDRKQRSAKRDYMHKKFPEERTQLFSIHNAQILYFVRLKDNSLHFLSAAQAQLKISLKLGNLLATLNYEPRFKQMNGFDNRQSFRCINWSNEN
jgi:hypothetical protein